MKPRIREDYCKCDSLGHRCTVAGVPERSGHSRWQCMGPHHVMLTAHTWTTLSGHRRWQCMGPYHVMITAHTWTNHCPWSLGVPVGNVPYSWPVWHLDAAVLSGNCPPDSGLLLFCCCLCQPFLSFSVFRSFLRVNSTSTSLAFFEKKPSTCCGPISSCLRTFHSHCCGRSPKILINLPAVHWAAPFYHNSRSRLDCLYRILHLKSNILTSYKSAHLFLCYSNT